MNRSTATIRMAFGLACLAASALLLADVLGLIPNSRLATLEGRSALCEALAIHTSVLATNKRPQEVEATLNCVVARNKELLSAGIRHSNGAMLVEVGAHDANWHVDGEDVSDDSHIYVPISAGDREWGTLELRFRPITRPGMFGRFWTLRVRLLLFISCTTLVTFFFYLRQMLAHLDPSRVIPDRVRAALDTLAEGLLVLDKNKRIVLANRAFSETVGHPAEALQGKRVTDLPWTGQSVAAESDAAWSQLKSDGKADMVMELQAADDGRRRFKVNTSPILGQKGEYRGALASFNDVTAMEKSREELQQMLTELRKSRDEIHRQNKELEVLATRDPLTGCLNRRSFFTDFQMLWKTAERHNHELSVMMVDIDHFKSINDNHGHSMGDAVLAKVGEVLRATARETDLVCRYGGEEFCVVLPFTDLEAAGQAAERVRSVIESTDFSGIRATTSLGVSSIRLNARDPQELMDQADKCLYVAKRNGRNQFVSFDAVPEDLVVDESQVSRTKEEAPEPKESIPISAATALISALEYRDNVTAEHCRRVADLCVAAAEGLMTISECYMLEIAALLHDIGKIGVPDAILLKQGPLTADEWKIMSSNERIGTEIVRAAFESEELHEIMQTRHAWYGGSPQESGGVTKEDIPVAARILAIADAYDSMVTDRGYRAGRSRDEAFAELRRCAGSQFDPTLVEHFIHVMRHRKQHSSGENGDASQATALYLGNQVERLALAMDQQNVGDLEAMAGRLKNTALKSGANAIADGAAKLEAAAGDQSEFAELLDLTNELLGMCRDAQSSYLETGTPPADAATAE